MPELLLKIYEFYHKGAMDQALAVQDEVCRIIYTMCSAHGNLYAVLKAILAKNGVDCGGVRKPLPGLVEADQTIVEKAAEMIDAAITKFC